MGIGVGGMGVNVEVGTATDVAVKGLDAVDSPPEHTSSNSIAGAASRVHGEVLGTMTCKGDMTIDKEEP